MTRVPFPLVWDNTMRTTFISCPRKFQLEFLQHYKPLNPSVHLHAGAAYARGLEVARKAYYAEGMSQIRAEALGLEALIHAYGDFECPPDSAKSLNRLGEAYVYYMTVFPMETDPAQPYMGPNGPRVEFSFALPLDEGLLHPETGEPIIYAGRADMVAVYAGALSIYDDKTTSSLGASWARSWDMRSQFTGYMWAARQYGINATQVLVRGISILKTKLDHAQAISVREPFRIERWHGQVVRDIKRAISCWEEGYFDLAEADACEAYGGCMFKQPCMFEDPSPWLDNYFEQRVWDPVSRTEESLVLKNEPKPEEWALLGNINDFKKGR